MSTVDGVSSKICSDVTVYAAISSSVNYNFMALFGFLYAAQSSLKFTMIIVLLLKQKVLIPSMHRTVMSQHKVSLGFNNGQSALLWLMFLYR